MAIRQRNWIGQLIGGSGGRKFIYTVGAANALAILVWFGRIDGSQFVNAFQVISGAFLAAHAAQEVTSALKGRGPDYE